MIYFFEISSLALWSFAMKYSSGTSTGAVNMEIKLPAISAIASP